MGPAQDSDEERRFAKRSLAVHETLRRKPFRIDPRYHQHEFLIRVAREDFYRTTPDIAESLWQAAEYDLRLGFQAQLYFLLPVRVHIDPALNWRDVWIREAAAEAEKHWVVLAPPTFGPDSVEVPDRQYQFGTAHFPKIDFGAAVDRAFADRTIDSFDDPLVQNLLTKQPKPH